MRIKQWVRPWLFKHLQEIQRCHNQHRTQLRLFQHGWRKMGLLCFVYFLLGCVKTVWTQLFESESHIHIYGHLFVQKTKEDTRHFQTSLCLWVKAGMRVLWNATVKHHGRLCLSKYAPFSFDHSWRGIKHAHLKRKGLRFRLTPICAYDVDSIFHVRKVPKAKRLACGRTEKGRLLNSACWQWLIYLSRRRHMLQLESFSHTHCFVLLWVVCMLWASPAPRQKRALGCIMALWSSHPERLASPS